MIFKIKKVKNMANFLVKRMTNFFVSDFYQNSAEMNLPRPEDLDEMGESSSAVVSV